MENNDATFTLTDRFFKERIVLCINSRDSVTVYGMAIYDNSINFDFEEGKRRATELCTVAFDRKPFNKNDPIYAVRIPDRRTIDELPIVMTERLKLIISKGMNNQDLICDTLDCSFYEALNLLIMGQ